MSDLHDLCRFIDRPIDESYVERLNYYLKAGIPATYTIEEAYNLSKGLEDSEQTSTTTPLHLIFTHFPLEHSEKELEIVNEMVSSLLEFGAGWCLTDVNDETPGCILKRRGLQNSVLYEQIVDAGVRAELLLRKVSEFDVEFIEGNDTENTMSNSSVSQGKHDLEFPQQKNTIDKGSPSIKLPRKSSLSDVAEPSDSNDASHQQEIFLKSELEYKDGALVTKDQRDGVMMGWEHELMKLGAESLFKGYKIDENEIDTLINILNIGFGMGIIDKLISSRNPTKHYICEAHPDVLRKLRDDGWYEKPNVVILEGRWQDQLHRLLGSGNVYFNGIYYDTFSEHYQDMLELFDLVVGLLKPHGVFSFFNGLGADREVIYDVYRKLVQIDLDCYGLSCQFTEVEVPEETTKKDNASVWDGIRYPYWRCSKYYHPEVRFVQ